MATHCKGITNKKGKQCTVFVFLPDIYCGNHNYFTCFEENIIMSIKNNDGKTNICTGGCKQWHGDVNPDTGKAFSVCFKCKDIKKIKPVDITCNWCFNFKDDSEYMQNIKNIKMMNAIVKLSETQEIPIIFGYNNFPKCDRKKINGEEYCTYHIFAKSYTDDQKNKVTNCLDCNQIKLLVIGSKYCNTCNNKHANGNAKQKAERDKLADNKCIAVISGNNCVNMKNNGDYCNKHEFIPSRLIANEEIGNMLCEINNIIDINRENTSSCKNCGIDYIIGTSITLKGKISDKCPYCLLKLREYDSKRDRNDRIHNLTPETKEKKRIWREENYELIAMYHMKYRGNKILKLGVDEYHRINNEYAKKKRALNPAKQQITNKLQNVNMKYKYGYYKRVAVDKGRIFELSYDECEQYFLSNCFYCDSKAIQGEIINGIDRIDNSKGYFLENCVPCCSMCNIMKGHKSNHIEFILICNHIMTHLNIINTILCPLIFKDHISGSYTSYNKSAIRRKHEFNISKNEFYSIINNNCYLCGKQNTKYNINGIDRIDNNIGYIFDNCRTCCTTCNLLKLDYNLNDVLMKLLKITINYNSKIKVNNDISYAINKIMNINYDINNNDIENNEVNNFNHIENSEMTDSNNIEEINDIDDYKYLNELEILLPSHNIDDIDNIIDRLNDLYSDANYSKDFSNLMDKQENSISLKFNEGVIKKEKNAIERRKIAKIINKPIEQQKLIENNTNPDILKQRVTKLCDKKLNKINNSEKTDLNIKENTQKFINDHKKETYIKITEHYEFYKKI